MTDVLVVTDIDVHGEVRPEWPHVRAAARIFDELILADELADFLTIPAYQALLAHERREGA